MMGEDNGQIDFAGEESIVFYERAVLGSLILEPKYLVDIDLSRDDFTDKSNQQIFAALREMDESAIPIDVITLAQHLEARGFAALTGGLPYLSALTQVPPAPKNVIFYAKNLSERTAAQGRAVDLAGISGRIGIASRNVTEKPGFDLRSHIEEVERDLDKIKSVRDVRVTLRHVVEVSQEAVGEIEARFENQGRLSGLPTGFDDLDEQLNGLQQGDLVVIAGRPSMGKTSLAMNIAENIVATDDHLVGLVVSLEMPSKQLVARMISSVGRVNSGNLRSGRLCESDFDRLTMACHKISGMRLYIDDRSTACIADLRSAARKVLAKEGRLDFMMVDYLQLMHEPSGSRSDDRTTEVSVISRGLKAMAKEFQMPVVALSQLNRSLEKRQDKRPIMSDLRESGAIEQDSDVILFVYRDEVYNPDTVESGLGEIIISKQRNGPIGTVLVNFEKEYSKFTNRSAGGF